MPLKKKLIAVTICGCVLTGVFLLAFPSCLTKMKAQFGDSDAQLEMGGLRAEGNATGYTDREEAVRYLSQSAEQGNATAQLHLAALYSGAHCSDESARGSSSFCEIDPIRSYMWLLIAEQQELADSLLAQGVITPEQADTAHHLAARWKAQHSQTTRRRGASTS